MTFEYVFIFLLLAAVSIGFYLIYQRFIRGAERRESGLYVQALRHLLDGDSVQAFGKLRQVVTEDTENIDAYLRLGQILREHKQPDRALQVHKDLTLRTGLPSPTKTAILHQLAEDYLAMKNYDMAQAALKELLDISSGDRWAHVRLLEMQEEARQWQAAFETASQLIKLEGTKSKKSLARYKHLMGEELYRRREYHKARLLFKEALGLDPGYVDAYLSIGDSYRDEERYEDAVNFWRKLIAAVPSQGHRVIERLKKALFDIGRYGELADVCQSILEHDPKNTSARMTLAEFSEKKGDIDTAREILEQILDDSPGHPEAMIELMRLYLARNEYKQVGDLIRRFQRRAERSAASGETVAPSSPARPVP